MVGAGLLARKAVERGLHRKPWVKTSLAPGSKVVADYLERAGTAPRPGEAGVRVGGLRLHDLHRQLWAPAPTRRRRRPNEHGLALVSVLSGNRNFEGRINPDVRMNYLASPPLVVAYALAGTMDIDLDLRAARHRPDGEPVTSPTCGLPRPR